MSWLREFPANQQVLPGSKEARRMTGGSGRKLLPLLSESVQPSSFLRTLLASLLSTEEWNSSVCYLEWRASVTPYNRSLFQLVPSTPNIEETGSGLWRTPGAEDGNRGARGPGSAVTVACDTLPRPPVTHPTRLSRQGGAQKPVPGDEMILRKVAGTTSRI